MTENHGYDTPKKGTTDWNVPVNSNFEQLDTDIEVRDSESNRSQYAPKQGAKFLATDTGRVYLGDGSAWNQIGSISQNGTTASSADPRQNGKIVLRAPNLAPNQTIDPANSSSPVQDAVDTVADNGGGEVLLPGTGIGESGPLYARSNVSLVGQGTNVTELSFPKDTDGIVFDASKNGSDAVSRFNIDGVALNGPGTSTSSGVAIHHVNGDTNQCHFGHVMFWGWNNSVYRVDSGVGPFENRHDQLTIYDCDAGNTNALLEFNSWYGPVQWFGTVVAYPADNGSGTTSTVVQSKGGTQSFDLITMGGTTGTVVHQRWDGNVRVGVAHWEPEHGLSATQANPGSLFTLESGFECEIGRVKLANVSSTSATVDYVYRLKYDSYNGRSPAQKRLGPVLGSDNLINNNVVDVADPANPSRPSFYFGSTQDVDVTHSKSKTGGLRVLDEAGVGMG